MSEDLTLRAPPLFSFGQRFSAAFIGMCAGGIAFACFGGFGLAIVAFLPIIVVVDFFVNVIPWFAAVYLFTRRVLAAPWLFCVTGAITGLLGMTAFMLGWGGRLFLSATHALPISLLAGAFGGFISWYFLHYGPVHR